MADIKELLRYGDKNEILLNGNVKATTSHPRLEMSRLGFLDSQERPVPLGLGSVIAWRSFGDDILMDHFGYGNDV